MDAIASYSLIFVDGATTSVKAGSMLCFVSAMLIVFSAVGMIISQTLENHYRTCEFKDLEKYNSICLKEFLENCKKNNPLRIFLSMFDVISAIMIIGVGNCLQNLFKNTTMARVMSGTLRLACFLVIFEVCYNSGLNLQVHDFAKYWNLENYRPQVIATYFMMDNSGDLVWTLDNLLYTYFLLLLGYIASDHSVFSKGYCTTAFIGSTCGFIQFFASAFVARRNRFVTWLIMHMYLVLQVCLLIVLVWTVGKKSKRGKKHRKGKKKNQACCVCLTNKKRYTHMIT